MLQVQVTLHNCQLWFEMKKIDEIGAIDLMTVYVCILFIEISSFL